MPYDISGDDIGAYEITGVLDEVDGMLDEAASGALFPRAKLRGLQAKVQRATAKALRRSEIQGLKAQLMGIRQGSLTTQVPGGPVVSDQDAGRLYELPFPLGSATITKSTTGFVRNNAQGAYRIERLVVDEASATPAPWLLELTDIKLGNISQPLSAGSMLATFFGPTSFNTPFKGTTIQNGNEARVDFLNLDTANSRVAYASFFGNAIR